MKWKNVSFARRRTNSVNNGDVNERMTSPEGTQMTMNTTVVVEKMRPESRESEGDANDDWEGENLSLM